ncbi:LysM peptidoglycan-binding domain-containing protein [Cytophagales bacterium LB-30]|uniref:LysM peptidoglycan-binding domain-containing protein n=1 Tax=Shiella aurantiaca TaxID=3058365 RepID=A0ABT8F180_9BACT|nr:LysM peptidoglycan-binding domain-containing protein [Shiella aurantiaca]MDN4164206.1 LysM peptidoglycan-binding domain-containing protein [Shiella aurantiaca]
MRNVRFLVITALFLVYSLPQFASDMPRDSVGMEKVGAKWFVLHEVEAKETLFSIAKRYGTTVADIVAANPGTDKGLSIGYRLKVPYGKPVAENKPASQTGATIKHTVAPSETLYSLSRKYQVSVDDIKQWNNLSSNELSIGQELIIRPAKAVSQVKETTSTAVQTQASSASDQVIHTVDISQTLFSISRMYNTTVDQIKAWNALTSNEISVGQKLIVGQKAKSAVTQTTSTPVEKPIKEDKSVVVVEKIVDTPMETTPVITPKKETAKVIDTNPVDSDAESNAPSTQEVVSSSSSFKKVVETGIAELIEGSGDSNKYRALHRTAPIGTIMHVRNDLNDMSVFVRIVGKIPDTGVNDKVVIKISKAAFDKLGGVNSRFPVEITYQP